jgi:hypothetical protein
MCAFQAFPLRSGPIRVMGDTGLELAPGAQVGPDSPVLLGHSALRSAQVTPALPHRNKQCGLVRHDCMGPLAAGRGSQPIVHKIGITGCRVSARPMIPSSDGECDICGLAPQRPTHTETGR